MNRVAMYDRRGSERKAKTMVSALQDFFSADLKSFTLLDVGSSTGTIELPIIFRCISTKWSVSILTALNGYLHLTATGIWQSLSNTVWCTATRITPMCLPGKKPTEILEKVMVSLTSEPYQW
jgi:hypothetical protein